MQIQFVLGNEIKHTARVAMTRSELLGSSFSGGSYYQNENKKFKIPLNVSVYKDKE